MNEQRADFELLRDFVRRGDQPAFAAVARRHLDLVYATALRKTESPEAAEEIAQNVFATLARKAWKFSRDDSLPAWLYRTTLLEAKEWWRGELRRRRREQTAAELGTTMKTPDEQPALRALLPLLDEALLSLREKDRAALLLRYYESRPLREVGAALNTSEDAAQKRVAGALEKVAQFFQRRGFRTATITATAAALEYTATSAPAVVAASVVQATAQMVPPAMLGFGAALSRLAGLGKIQTAALSAAILVAPVWQWTKFQTAKSDTAQARLKLDSTRMELEAARDNVAQLQAESVRLDGVLAEEQQAARKNVEAVQRLEELKKRLHGLLAASDYRWPDDLPFVRVPREAVDEVHSSLPPFDPSGKFSPWAVELLGLTTEQKSFVESHLSEYLQKVYDLAASQAYETNSYPQPKGWIAKTIAVPDLGKDREQLWVSFIDPVVRKLGGNKRDDPNGGVANRFESFWAEGLSGFVSYPWVYDNAQHERSPQRFTLAIKQDGTETPQYTLVWEGTTARTGSLPIRIAIPDFLRERFEAWLRQLGFTNTFANPQ